MPATSITHEVDKVIYHGAFIITLHPDGTLSIRGSR